MIIIEFLMDVVLGLWMGMMTVFEWVQASEGGIFFLVAALFVLLGSLLYVLSRVRWWG